MFDFSSLLPIHSPQKSTNFSREGDKLEDEEENRQCCYDEQSVVLRKRNAEICQLSSVPYSCRSSVKTFPFRYKNALHW